MSQLLNYHVFNIKLQSNKTGDDRTLAYIALIEKLTQKPYKYLFLASKNQGVVMYGSLKSKDGDKIRYLYGKAAKGLYIPGSERQVLKDGEVNVESNSPTDLINPVISNYLFFPDAHRLFLEKIPNGATHLDIEAYLHQEVKKLVAPDEILEIVLEKDESAIQEIFSAKVVHSISYKVSYTNEDFLDDLAEEYDKELKDNNIGEITVTAKADNHSEGLKIDKSPILGGGLKLAETNGEIRSASITPAGSKVRKSVSNKNRPKLLSIKIEDTDNFWEKWFRTVVNIYRSSRQ